MDSLTQQIIAILRRDGRASYSDIARELDTTRDNVASRVNPMFQSGELRVIAAPHPRVLGLTVSAHISIKVKGDPQQVVKSLEQLDSLAFIAATAGAYQLMVETDLGSMTELRQQVAMIRAWNGVIDVQVLLYERVLNSFFLGPEPETLSFTFDEFDVSILKRLQQDGRASYADLAETVGLSLSGCRIRVQRLLESGVMQIGAIPQRSDMNDDLLFGVGINAPADLRDVTKLLRAAPGLEFMARTVGCYDLIATISFRSLRDFKTLMSSVSTLSSVSYCEQWLHVQLVRERYERTLDAVRVVRTGVTA